MFDRMVDISKLLPIAIMAHNEEKVIGQAIESILTQRTPVGYCLKAMVVANGCIDRTEEIVSQKAKHFPDRVHLVSIKEKGKTKAINESVKWFEKMVNSGFEIPYVIFLDADCEFNGQEIVVNLVKRFENNPNLCAVGAHCIPDICFNSRKDIVAEIYRTIDTLSRSLTINSLSGMCYGIRMDVLRKIDFPEFQFAEDMYLCARLDGWFLKDKNIQIVFKTPSDLLSEIHRRTRQEISTRRYHNYYSHLKKKGVRVSLFEKSLSDDYRWRGATEDDIIKTWWELAGIKPKFLVLAYILIRALAKIKAQRTLKKMRKDGDLDYWKVLR